jgi:hypothetical protein
MLYLIEYQLQGKRSWKPIVYTTTTSKACADRELVRRRTVSGDMYSYRIGKYKRATERRGESR